MDIQRICIIGLGLIGGSLAKAIKRTNPDYYITAADINPHNLTPALDEGIIDRTFGSSKEAVKDADLIFISVPVGIIPKIFNEIK